jgi:hypothetical protein
VTNAQPEPLCELKRYIGSCVAVEQDIMTDERSPPHERPRSEPEIIPPGAPLRPPRDDPFGDTLFSQRIYVTRLGPLGLFGIMLAIGVVAVVVLALVVGVVLFWLPIVALIVAAAIVGSRLRSRFRWWR